MCTAADGRSHLRAVTITGMCSSETQISSRPLDWIRSMSWHGGIGKARFQRIWIISPKTNDIYLRMAADGRVRNSLAYDDSPDDVRHGANCADARRRGADGRLVAPRRLIRSPPNKPVDPTAPAARRFTGKFGGRRPVRPHAVQTSVGRQCPHVQLMPFPFVLIMDP